MIMSIDAQQVAEALHTDPFYVEESAAADLNEKLLDKAEATAQKADYDVYVIAVDAEYIDDDLLEQIKVHHGGQGSFVMINTGSDLAVDLHFEDQHELQMQAMEQLSIARKEWNVSTPSTTKLNMLLDLYADPQTAPEGDTSTAHESQSSEVATVDGSGSFASLLLGVAVLILALVIAGAWFFRDRRRRVQARRTRQQFQLPGRLLDRVDTLQRRTLRESINSETMQLAAEIESLQTRSLNTDDSARVERGLDAYRIARRIVDDEGAERIDLAGAMVLLRQAGREIAEVKLESGRSRRLRGARTRKKAAVQSLCTINPLHGEASAAARVITEASADAARAVRVPVCPDCLDDLRSRREPQWIYDGDRPYAEVPSVWSETLFGAIGGDLVTELHRQRPELD